ncbi:histidinol dehydrogenase [Pontibacter ummariensis]|uniref:Histidinol dehydrogenase n=1 Tax=Pontibacter ummariensis TaxID=1610492 RepID=A0A239BX88_9BACT|nr:histidinol dehydrogenase [Pontibacter ummariensis]PRY15566.1 histidinol dehydrogenase [Pontibacter ummariensis]SNS12526.1 histidinol dehydrogenase [Pontibacter ummariensis]
MRKLINPPQETWQDLVKRPTKNLEELEPGILETFRLVQEQGDEALRQLAQKHDSVTLDNLVATTVEISQAEAQVPVELKEAILQAYSNIQLFHTQQAEPVKKVETMAGVTCWRKSVAIEKVGLYIPGGTAPLFSTLLMLGVPARIAGCKELVLCTPPSKDGNIHPAILYTASLLGVTRVVKAGGAQAVAALAFGTESVPAVHKIFGPGNQYVTVAKQLVSKAGVAIDLPAGPSEVLVIADASANPAFVAADLLSQAEHGADSQVVLLTSSAEVLEKVEQELQAQLEVLPRKEFAAKALSNSLGVVLGSVDEMLAFSNQYAPEHLILSIQNFEEVLDQITNAGSVFLGNYSPESAGDYASGTNHTLPTNGYARAYSGVSLDSFVKKITFQHITPEGLQHIGKTIETMAAAEGLEAHKNAVSIRLKEVNRV